MANRGSGQLYQRVAFDERALSSDGHGNEENDFVQQFECRADFTFLRGGETVIAGRLEGRQPIVVRVRANSNTRQANGKDWARIGCENLERRRILVAQPSRGITKSKSAKPSSTARSNHSKCSNSSSAA
ncbi:hypothetical protein AJ87_15165 [Rhizobium yanglingense]|nr:hypothetical protein AJ87_15165 [Rhizobium yanglingense]